MSRRPRTTAVPPAPSRRPTSTPLPVWAAACFFVSGAAGLLYEVVWSKELSHVLGNSLHAMATVVAAFLCGLALGAWKLGPRVSRARTNVRTYAGLELGIAALGVLSVPALRNLDPLFGALGHALGYGAAFATARFAVVFALLLPPTALMGATLPVLVDAFERERLGPGLAALYAVNTAGAVAGSLAGGFVLLPGVGLLATTWAAALLNLAAAGLAMAFARVAPPGAAAAPERVLSDAANARAAGSGAAVALCLAVSGFAALTFQFAWVRLFGLVLGSSVYSFSGVLGVYLAGLALGAALAAPLLHRGGGTLAFAVLQVGLAVVAAGALWMFPWLPEWYYAIAQRAGDRWTWLVLAQLALPVAVLFAPCVLLGAIFPLGASLLPAGSGARAAGRAYAANTAGTIAGSLVAGFVLVPRLGVPGTHLVALALSLATGGFALALAFRRGPVPRRAAVAAPVAALAAVALAALAPRWDPALMSAGVFRPTESERVRMVAKAYGDRRDAVRFVASLEKPLFYREGVNGSVFVSTDSTGKPLYLRLGGKVDASTSDMLTQVLIGILPAALADSGARSLVIGHGSGVTLASALAAGAGQTDLAELEPAVLEASRLFHAGRADPLDDPRVRVLREDGRTVLARGGERYGLIISEPSNPWLAGVNNLFTREFYTLARSRLAPGGVFCQWVQLYEISPETLGSILAAYLATFPEGYAFLGSNGLDLMMIATPMSRRLSSARLASPAVRGELARAGVPSPEAIPAYYLAPLDSLRSLAVGAPANTDDRPYVEYRAPRDLVVTGRAAFRGEQPMTERLPRGPFPAGAALFADWTPEAWHDARVRELARVGRFDDARFTARALAATGDTARAASLLAIADERERGRRAGELLVRARASTLSAHMSEALEDLAEVVELTPDNGRAWVLLAETHRALGDAASARAAAERALAIGRPDEKGDALICMGLLAIAANQPAAAAERFAAAQRANPSTPFAYVFEAQARLDAGDRTGARSAVRRGLVVAPDNERLRALGRELGAE